MRPQRAFALAARGGTVAARGADQSSPNRSSLADLVLREIDVRTTVAHVCDDRPPGALDLLTSRLLSDVLVDRVVPLDRVVARRPSNRSVAARTNGKILVDPGAMADVAVLGLAGWARRWPEAGRLAGHRSPSGTGAGHGSGGRRGAGRELPATIAADTAPGGRSAATVAPARLTRSAGGMWCCRSSPTCCTTRAGAAGHRVLRALAPGAGGVVILATSGVAAAKALAEGIDRCRAPAFVDAPVSGSVPRHGRSVW